MQFASAFSRGARDYWSHVRGFSPNARYFLVSSLFNGVIVSVYAILFNFYLVSLGYAQDFLGLAASVNQFIIIAVALPAGVLGNIIGRRNALLLGTLGNMLSFVLLSLFTGPAAILLINVLYGASNALIVVMGSPFLMDNSHPGERQHLFSIYSAVSAGAGVIGGFVAGNFPAWFGSGAGMGLRDPRTYQATLIAVAVLNTLALSSLWRIPPAHAGERRLTSRALAPGLRRNRGALTRLFLPIVIMSLGAGMLIPFGGVFFRSQYGASDAEVGLVYALAAVGCAGAIALGPLTAARFGKIRAVIAEEALSLPMLLLAGFAPGLGLGALGWVGRMALMQMNGPIFNAYMMEALDDETRATAASLNHMAWTVGSAVTPVVSGVIQVRYGWTPLVLGMAGSYALAIALNFLFFWRRGDAPLSA